MKAALLHRYRQAFDDGGILEVVIWRVPDPVEGSLHPFKYRLFYGFPGQRLVGYDNERGKGDHRHLQAHQEPHAFTTPEQLIDDFLADVRDARRAK